MDEQTKTALRQERAELQAAIDAAEQWGAGITARLERIRAIDAALMAALMASSEHQYDIT